ncbi:uncharacterized protein LOC100373162 [Saccoglossus kowalevskii]
MKKDEVTKQIPLCFALMSGKSKSDYKAVMRAVKELLPADILLKEIMADYEEAIWRAARDVFDGVEIKGCSFHWRQAVYRKVQAVGLHQSYMKKDATYKLLRQVLALPYLPEELILDMFEKLREKATTDKLKEVFNYVDRQWIRSSVMPPSTWNCYLQTVRTNNDLEGWHSRLNKRGKKANLPFYLLVSLLHKEATYITIQAKLVSEKKLQRHQKKNIWR